MRYLMMLLLLVLVVALIVAILWLLVRPRITAAPLDEAGRARWRPDDTGVTADGDAEMAIVLAVPNKPHWPEISRKVIGTYSPGDFLRWAELQGDAEGIAKDLNDRIEQRR